MHKVIYLYILECSDGKYYTGVTNNLQRRLLEHNLGYNPSSFTYTRRPVKLVFQEIFSDFEYAFQVETQIKKWSHSKKKALIDGDFKALILLSKKSFK